MVDSKGFRAFLGPEAAPELDADRPTRSAEILASPAPMDWAEWERLYAEPFVGITTDGTLVPDLYKREPNGAPTAAMVEAAATFLELLDEHERRQAQLAIDAPEWRRWQNTAIYLPRDGLRMETLDPRQKQAAMALLQSGLSAEGFRLVNDVMKLNAFSGQFIGRPRFLNEWTFNIGVFGVPSLDEPWGWQIFGHHLAINCLVIGHQMVMSPLFIGSEPTYCDEGEYEGVRVFDDREQLGLSLMRSLTDVQRDQATLLPSLAVADMPPGRLHWSDERHLAGAFQDNRIIPFEGVRVSGFTASQREHIMRLVEAYMAPLPEGPRDARIREIEHHLDSTHFAWMGRVDDSSPFYYRVHSPVVIIEFDHHSGIYLRNREPDRFHVHTVVRTPNGNDFGKEVLRQHYAQSRR